MTAYSLLPEITRSCFLLFLLLSILCLLYYFIAATRSFGWKNGVLSLCLFAATLLVLFSLLEYQFAMALGVHTVSAITRLPYAVILAYIILVSALTWHLMFALYRQMNSEITPMSIKESFDNLPTGLCFATDFGLPLLVNRKMQELCESLTGESLLNAGSFWQAVTQSGEQAVVCIGQSAWSFQRSSILLDGLAVTEITAFDTTEEYNLSIQLIEKNRELSAMNARLRRFSETVAQVTKQEEILAAKIWLHDNLGRALLATRRYLARDDGESNPANMFSLWANIVTLFGKTAEREEQSGDFEQLSRAAEVVGVSIKWQGVLPSENAFVMGFIVAAARECLTNAVHHALATEMTVEVSEQADGFRAIYFNNGKLPEGDIYEGGGLSNLRNRIESVAGSMKTEWYPLFRLTVWVPRDRGDFV